MKRTLALVMLVAALVLALACSDDAPPTPTATPEPTQAATPQPSPSPTPEPTSLISYESLELGLRFEHPEEWMVPEAVEGEQEEWLLLAGEGGEPSMRLLVRFHDVDVPLEERMDSVIEELTAGDESSEEEDAGEEDIEDDGAGEEDAEDDGDQVERTGVITLDNGKAAERADILRDVDGTSVLQRVQVTSRATFTFAVVLEAPATDMEDLEQTFDAVLGSFESFTPAPYGVERGRAFTMPLGEPRTMDPAVARETTSVFFVVNVFSGLVRLGDDHSVQPDLAERWEVDESGTVYTFTLRDGISFHDGRSITAEDFKYSMERVTALEFDSDTVPLYLGDIVGVNEKLNGEIDEIDGVEVIDEQTLRITIDARKEYFLAKLTYPSSYVVDRRTVEAKGDEWWMGEDINGSGPFKLTTWETEEYLVLERFDGFHRAPDLEYVVSPNGTVAGAGALDMYLSDAWDAVSVGVRSLDRVEEVELTAELREYPQLTSYFVSIDGTRPPFDDLNVRRAFAMALDRQGLIDERLEGNVTLANGLLPPGIPGYSESLQGIPFDPDEARRLLAESKYADDLPEIVYTAVDYGGQPSSLIQYMLDGWRDELGVEVSAGLLDSDTYYYALEEAGDHLFMYGWVADYPDPENFLDLLLHSDVHDSRYVSQRFDVLVERARIEPNRETRIDLYRQAEQLLMDDAGIIPLFHVKDYVLVRPHVMGFDVSPLGLPKVEGITLGPIGQ